MPRHQRTFMPGVPVHLIQRGNNRQHCFYTKRDYIVYLEKLLKSSSEYGVAIHAFVLMTNHVHLLCTPSRTDSTSRMMQGLGRYYVRYINSAYRRSGTLWEGRFKASIIHSEQYLLTVSRYIELNPVRANMVNHPAEYLWSSYKGNGYGKAVRLLTPHPVYLRLGNTDLERQQAYRSLFASDISAETLEQIREATNKSWVIGDERFKQQIEEQLGRALPPFPRGGNRKSGASTINPSK